MYMYETNVTSGGLHYTLCAIIYILFLLQLDKLMTVAEATETCQ